jgi:class 3 adenylate cyclase
MIPETRYAHSGEASMAYQVFGHGEIDLLLLSGWLSHIEQLWEAAPQRRFLEALAEFSRVILYDPRGTGLSDEPSDAYPLEQEAADALAVLDAVGSTRAALYTKWTGGPVGLRLAVDHPERIDSLVMFSSMARTSWAPDYDWAMTIEQRQEFAQETIAHWGETDSREIERWAPSMAHDPALGAWLARLVRSIASPGQARIRWREMGDLDVRDLLPRVTVPALIMHRRDQLVWDVRHSRYLAEHIPGARYVELEGADTLDFTGDSDTIIEEIEEFLTGRRGRGENARMLLTVMFTDISDSTDRAAQLGDGAWRDLLAEHDKAVRKELALFGGREVKTTGDGFLATFAGTPSSALRCASSIVEATADLGVGVRIGMHTGECEVIGEDVGGMAVHIASRVGSVAEPGEVLVSSAVSGAVAGGHFDFDDRGTRELKGVPGQWHTFALAGPPPG